jgi:hypothetical protein
VVGGGGSNDEESERENGASSGREGKGGARPCPFYREKEGRGEVVGGEREAAGGSSRPLMATTSMGRVG